MAAHAVAPRLVSLLVESLRLVPPHLVSPFLVSARAVASYFVFPRAVGCSAVAARALAPRLVFPHAVAPHAMAPHAVAARSVAPPAVAFRSLRVARLVLAAHPARSATPASRVAEFRRSATIHLVTCHLYFPHLCRTTSSFSGMLEFFP